MPVKTDYAASKLPSPPEENVNEAILLHGCPPDVLLNILKDGVNERYSGGNAGTMFGDGVYLAEDVGKTDQYATCDAAYDPHSSLHKRLYGKTVRHPGNIFYVIGCRVMLGMPARTQESGEEATSMDNYEPLFPKTFRELAPVPNVTPPVSYHSLIAEKGGALLRFREFITFHGERVLPEVLLAYQRMDGDSLERYD